jgi:polysaccharide biosynthesis protein PslG
MACASVLTTFLALSGSLLGQIADDEGSPFGIVCPWPGVSETGARWVRCGAGATQIGNWPVLEPERGVFDWKPAEDEWSGMMEKERLFVAPILGYTPKWASPGPDGEASYPPSDLRDYALFCTEIAGHFRGRIGHWECWNEPNIEFLSGTIPEFADLQKTLAVAVRRADPDARVLFGATAGVDLPFIARCYEQGVRDYFDIMAVHPYQWDATFNDGWFVAKLTSLRELMDQWGDREKPIWLNELGWATSDPKITEDVQARLLVQCFVTTLTLAHLGVERTFWFAVKDWGGPGYGIFADDGHRKPSFLAYQRMTAELYGRAYVGRVPVEGARAYLFGPKAAGQAGLLVVWAGGLEPVDVAFPIQADGLVARGMLGTERTLDAGKGLSLAAYPAPTYIDVPMEQATILAEAPPERRFAHGPTPCPPVWVSAHPAKGTNRVWLTPGRATEVELLAYNGTERPVAGEVTLTLARQTFAAPLTIEALATAAARVSVTLPEGTPEGLLTMAVGGRLGDSELAPCTQAVRVTPGPTIEFLANSFVERQYLQPGAQCGCSESRRFGTSWTYRLPVTACSGAEVTMSVGAHEARAWSVSWSQDGASWTPLLEGKSPVGQHAASLPALADGALYLRCEGDSQQVDEVAVVCGRPL